ncbi:hypothetical protein AWL63_24250 (plasmid) [Sphingomonas panacis]|uniref:Uncharacterized protein n=1 Tax=Sphingomonas panacis TaxID=1560345 RepID=A0A1B3ZIL5_9SPHN|nr:hypothetical protein AWL63_24250 [Sphingomonas panacis]
MSASRRKKGNLIVLGKSLNTALATVSPKNMPNYRTGLLSALGYKNVLVGQHSNSRASKPDRQGRI